jgi:hypothetical protein
MAISTAAVAANRLDQTAINALARGRLIYHLCYKTLSD